MTDPLSDILAVLRIDTVLPVQMEAHGRWGLRYPSFRHMKFGGIIEGERWIWAEGIDPIRLEAGSFYLLTDGRSYCMASDPDAPLADGAEAFAGYEPGRGPLRYGHGDPRSTAIAGRFTFVDDHAADALRMLPPFISIPAKDAEGTALSTLLDLIASETQALEAGVRIAASSLANLVLVHIVRAWLAMGERPASWLAATSDQQVGAALAAMHGQVDRVWSLDQLARHVGMSRSLFARRFTELVGIPPMSYLLRWRMTVACAALRDGDKDMSKLARRLGYGSATAFRIAFRREIGESPGRYRLMSDRGRCRTQRSARSQSP